MATFDDADALVREIEEELVVRRIAHVFVKVVGSYLGEDVAPRVAAEMLRRIADRLEKVREAVNVAPDPETWPVGERRWGGVFISSPDEPPAAERR